MFRKTYTEQRAGQLREKVEFITPVRTLTTSGGERRQWASWKDTRANVEAMAGSEGNEGPQMVASNKKQFIVRSKSVPGLNETMAINYDGDTYNIERIDKAYNQGRVHTMFTVVIATRKEQAITPVASLVAGTEPVFQDFAQSFGNVTGTFITVTSGSLIPTAQGAGLINQLLFVFRSGLRLTYNQAGDLGFTIDNATNRINFNSKLRGENVLVHQYQLL